MTISNDTNNLSYGATAVAGKSPTAWHHPGPTAFDFRSDTTTVPNASMLKALTNATALLDDVFGEDPSTNDLQAFVAQLTGHEEGMIVVSGTMANQVALRTHVTDVRQPICSILCDSRGHIVNWEAGGIASISHATVIPVMPSNGHHLTLEDVQKHAVISDNIHHCPTGIISLENTLDGMIMPVDEVKRICAFARQHGIKVHLDGARLWEAVAAGAGSLSDFATCADSVNLCFSKGLGAPMGSIIVSSKDFVVRAKRVRKLLGGGIRQGAGLISATARVAVEEGFGTTPLGGSGMLSAVHDRARLVADMWTSRGGSLANPVETNMVWLDLQREGYSNPEFIALAATEGIKTGGGRLVMHYQISDEGIERLGRVMDKMRAKKGLITIGHS